MTTTPIAEDSPTARPLLSLIVGARNDSYMGDFKWRFSTTLNFLARNLSRLGRLADVEVVVCDWNSDEPLHRVLALSPAACAMTRFVVVPPSLARPRQLDSPFPIPIVQNTVIRRAEGEFIGQTDSDVLYSCASLHALLSVLDGTIPGIPARHAYLPAWRRHLPLAQVLRQSSLAELDEYVMHSGGQLAIDPPGAGYGAPTALALLHRDLWHACQGYDERFIYWGWMDVDLALRITQRHPMLDLNNFKLFNDTYGHHVGDQALREVADALRNALRQYDLCVRFAGDEFIVVISDCPPEHAELKRVELQQRIGAIEVDVQPGQRIRLAASAGAAVFPDDGQTYEALLADADRRMYEDKSRRRSLMSASVSESGTWSIESTGIAATERLFTGRN